jgi:alpha-glucosidase
MLALPGASYLYQGEELGLPEHSTLAPEHRQDPTFYRTDGQRVGRDGCRVPLPWHADRAALGFSESGLSWLPQPESYRALARDRQAGVAGSTLELYRAALKLRRERNLGAGSFEWLAGHTGEGSLGFTNQNVKVLHNFSDQPIALPEGARVLIGSAQTTREETAAEVLPDETVWFI